ncbi:MAG TPA: DMT family transporter [Myxococcaceae bacterium]|nr:DMT family transporter [Myxococcaceae bacterium]
MNDRTERAALADGVLVVVTAIWGASFVVVQDAVRLADPFTFLVFRFIVGASVLTVPSWRALADRRLLRAAAGLGVLLFVGFVTQTAGLQFTTPSRSGFLTGLSVLLVPFVGLLLFRKWPSPPVLVGVALAVAGLWFLTGGMSGSSGPTAKGDLLTIACAVAFAFYIVLLEPAARVHRSTPLVAVQLWVVALLALAALPFVPRHLDPSPAFWSAVLYTGLLSTAVCLLAQTWAQARTSAVRAALIFALEPVFAALWSVMIGRERLGSRELTGGTLIVLGIVAAEIGAALWARRRAVLS